MANISRQCRLLIISWHTQGLEAPERKSPLVDYRYRVNTNGL